MCRSGAGLLLHDLGFSGSSHFRLECAPYLVPTHPPLQICSNPARRSSITQRSRVEIWGSALFQLSVHLIPYASSPLVEKLQTCKQSPRGMGGWEMRTGAGWQLVKRNILGAKKSSCAPLLIAEKASRGSFARAGPEIAHREIVCEPLLIWT